MIFFFLLLFLFGESKSDPCAVGVHIFVLYFNKSSVGILLIYFLSVFQCITEPWKCKLRNLTFNPLEREVCERGVTLRRVKLSEAVQSECHKAVRPDFH